MSPLEPSYPTTAGPAYSNMAKTQDRDLKMAFMNSIEVLNEEMDRSPKEIQGNTTGSE